LSVFIKPGNTFPEDSLKDSLLLGSISSEDTRRMYMRQLSHFSVIGYVNKIQNASVGEYPQGSYRNIHKAPQENIHNTRRSLDVYTQGQQGMPFP
jgi:hypothetical protein